jgi:hypothetical protein
VDLDTGKLARQRYSELQEQEFKETEIRSYCRKEKRISEVCRDKTRKDEYKNKCQICRKK